LELALLREAGRFGELCATADKAEGAAAFLEKRMPAWKAH
jgi:enoyl-CoA hydratase